VIRHAAMGRIDRKAAEDYLKSVGLDPSVIDRFGKNASASDVLMGLAQKPGQGLTAGFGDEITSRLVAPIAMATGLTYEEAQQAIEDRMRRQADAASARHPILSAGLEIAGSVAGAKKLTSAFPNITKRVTDFATKGVVPSLVTSGATGAISGGIYGLGNGEGDVQARLKNAGDMGLLGGLFGLGGAAASRPVANLTERALKFVRKARPEKIAQMPGGITRSPLAVDAATTQGSVIPLTKGQATQNPQLQSLENMARSGALDDTSQASMLAADYKQQDAIKNGIERVAGGEASENSLTKAGEILRKGYKDIKGHVSKAYDDAAAIRGVFVDKKPMAESFAPKINDIMYKQGFDASNLTPESKKILGQIGTLKDPKVSAVNLEKMEFWRRKVNNRAEQMKGDPEGVLMGRVVKAYDDFMAKLPEGALKAGDESALQQILDARSLRKRQGVLFERNKVVSDIVKGSDLTNEELANLVLTGSGRGQSIHAGSGKAVRAMKRAAGDNAGDLVDNLRKGTFARILYRSTVNTQRAGTDIQMISPSKLLKELDGLSGNRSFMEEVFDEQGRNTIMAMRNDLRKVVSEQPGTKNYSNSAYTIMNYLRRLPLGLSGLSGLAEIGLKPVAQKAARDELEKSLQDVIGQVQSELMGKAKLYGAAAAGGQGGKQAVEINGRE